MVTNLMAMAALPGGSGLYRAEEVDYLLRTAYTGFRAAVLESERQRQSRAPVMVRTGFWG